MKKYLITFFAFMFMMVVLFADGDETYDINIADVPNGTYMGKQKAQYNHVYKVSVTVDNGKLTTIKLTSKVPSVPAKKYSDAAFAAMIKENKIDVDDKTGATWKKLVYNALKDSAK